MTAKISNLAVVPKLVIVKDLTQLPLKLPTGGKHSATLAAAKAIAKAKGAKRLKDVYRLLDELWRLSDKVGYDFGILAAHSANETNWWRSDAWDLKLSCAGIGADDGRPFSQWPAWKTPEQSARAMIVHYSAYIGGYVSALRPYIEQDPKWQAVFEAGYPYKGQVLADLGGRWMTDAYGPEAVADKLRAIQAQATTPTPTPQPSPGGAPVPGGIIYHESSNWHERYPGATPQMIVYHCTDDLELDNTISWFTNANSGASSHFVIARNGDIHQFVSTTKASWTNGDVDNPRTDIAELNRRLATSYDWPAPHTINDYSVTIEHVATPSVPPTEEQYRASIAISAYCRDRYNIKISRATCVRHGDINSVNRYYCPGPDYDLARVITDLGGDPEDMGLAA